MYVIFKNECRIILTDEVEYARSSRCFYWDKISKNFDIEDFTNDNREIFIYHSNLEVLWVEFQSKFHCIDAAGGLVTNDQQEVLMIFRLGKWDLPKGKVEKGEELSQAACREVEEECGIENVEVKEFFMNTHHIYYFQERWILKNTFWFLMTNNTPQNDLIPQIEEDIAEVCWFDRNAIKVALQNTYPNIKLLIYNYLNSKSS